MNAIIDNLDNLDVLKSTPFKVATFSLLYRKSRNQLLLLKHD